MVCRSKIADQPREIHIRFRNKDVFEKYINAIDQDYDPEAAIFNGYIFKFFTSQFNLVNRSQYGNVCDFKHEITEYRCNNCYIPIKGYCFIKCKNFITGEDYKEQNLKLVRNEKRRSNVMSMARIQPFCRTNIINIGY